MTNLKLEGKPISDLLANWRKRQADREVTVAEQARHMDRLDDELSQYRKEVMRQIEAGGTSGNRLHDMIIRSHGLDHFAQVSEAYRVFEDKLKGKKGELFLLSFQYNVTNERYLPHGWQHCFRLGLLEGEELIWNDRDGFGHSISVPVSRYVYGNRPVVEANILSYGHSMDDPFKTFFGIYILSKLEGIRIPQGLLSEDTLIEEIVVGDEAVTSWVATHSYHIPQEFFATAREALGNFFLKPMGPNDGPSPHEAPDPLGR